MSNPEPLIGVTADGDLSIRQIVVDLDDPAPCGCTRLNVTEEFPDGRCRFVCSCGDNSGVATFAQT